GEGAGRGRAPQRRRAPDHRDGRRGRVRVRRRKRPQDAREAVRGRPGARLMSALLGGVAAVVSAAIWAFSSTYMTEPARKWGGRATNLFKSTIASVCFLATLLIAYGPDAFRIPGPVWIRFSVSGILGLAIADTAYLSALKHIGPTLTAIVYETSGIFTCVLGA